METPKSAADRIRPILEAMERSIDSARRERLCRSGAPQRPSPPPSPAADNGTPAQENQEQQLDDNPRPLKARPKRPSSFTGSQSSYSPPSGSPRWISPSAN